MPDSSVDELAEMIGLPRQPLLQQGGEMRAKWLCDVVSQWIQLVTLELGIEPALTLASTAAKLGIPRTWRNAYKALAKRSDAWEFTRNAYYGGRVHCRKPDWEGRAVEYDLRSAYGWSLTNPLPDWKIYDRKPLPRQPAWYDVTVRLTGDIGPIPVRDEEQTFRLTYPTDTQVRGIWTKEDLERSGVGVVTVHRVLAGRWSKDLAPSVETWMERREKADKPQKALYRALANSLAGMLCQKSTGWALWTATNREVPPKGAVPLSINSALWAVPVNTAHDSITCPQAGSYVTALVRSKMWTELRRPDVLYSDTDSIHLPEDAQPPADFGPHAGQFAEKERGLAHYYGLKHYVIGNKVVQPATLFKHFALRSSRSDRRNEPQF
jgi:hypothetical protein